MKAWVTHRFVFLAMLLGVFGGVEQVSAQPFLFSANPNDVTVTRIDLATGQRTVIMDANDGLTRPTKLAIDPFGNLYVANVFSPDILRLSRDGQVTVFVSRQGILNIPRGLAFGPQGDLFFAEGTSIYRFNANSGSLAFFGDVTSADPVFNKLEGIEFDRNGNLYAASGENSQGRGAIVKFDSQGTASVIAAGLEHPVAVAADDLGHLYVANFHGEIIRIDLSTGSIQLFADISEPIGNTRGVTTDLENNVYVLNGTGEIRKWNSDGSGGNIEVRSGSSFSVALAFFSGQDVLLEDDFNAENGGVGQLNYFGFANWDITDGAVDLIGNGFFDVLPSNGLYLNLDGAGGNAGRIESKTAFTLDPGDVITLMFDLAGSQQGDVNTVTVTLGSLYAETFTLPSSDPFTTITRTITVESTESAKLIFDHEGGDNLGLLLDDVKLSRVLEATPPLCKLQAVNPGPPTSLDVFIHDPNSGVATVHVIQSKNAAVEIPKGSGNFFSEGDVVSFIPPETASFLINGIKINQNQSSSVAVRVTDTAGNTRTCDPVLATVEADIPETFRLEQNFPNPFNPRTMLPFHVAESAHVRLVVYDVRGREVITLVDEALSAGVYEAEWEGRDAQGQLVPSGVYLYRMVADGFVQVKQMTLLK